MYGNSIQIPCISKTWIAAFLRSRTSLIHTYIKSIAFAFIHISSVSWLHGNVFTDTVLRNWGRYENLYSPWHQTIPRSLPTPIQPVARMFLSLLGTAFCHRLLSDTGVQFEMGYRYKYLTNLRFFQEAAFTAFCQAPPYDQWLDMCLPGIHLWFDWFDSSVSIIHHCIASDDHVDGLIGLIHRYQ